MMTLFLGGCADGARREVDAHVDRVQVPKPRELRVERWDEVRQPGDQFTEILTYRRIYLPTHRGERRSFFLLAGMDPEDALRYLLDHYHPGEAINASLDMYGRAVQMSEQDSHRRLQHLGSTGRPYVVIILPPKAAIESYKP